jgi:deazaflavin-dependent oxidoreductase (nitroreductase family)
MSDGMEALTPPRGLSRLLYRLPILFYQTRLGWLMGSRFLMLTHTGRVSGLPRRTVLEIVRMEEASGAYYVVSAWGEKSDWLRNVRQSPQVLIQVGRRQMKARAEPLGPTETEREVLDYARRHPNVLRTLLRLIGYRSSGTLEDLKTISRVVVVVAFQPTS